MQVLRVDLASHLEPRGQGQGGGGDGGLPPHGLVPAAQVSPHGPLAHRQGAEGQNSLTERGRGHEAAMQASARGRGGQAQLPLQEWGLQDPAPTAGMGWTGPSSRCRDGVDRARLLLQGQRGGAPAPAAGMGWTGPGSRCRDGGDGPSSHCRDGVDRARLPVQGQGGQAWLPPQGWCEQGWLPLQGRGTGPAPTVGTGGTGPAPAGRVPPYILLFFPCPVPSTPCRPCSTMLRSQNRCLFAVQDLASGKEGHGFCWHRAPYGGWSPTTQGLWRGSAT